MSVAALASVTLLGASVASAVVLDSKSSAFKQRDHIYNQIRTKEVICLAKADPGNGTTHAGSLDLIGAALFDAANPIFNDADDCGSSASGSFLDAPILY